MTNSGSRPDVVHSPHHGFATSQDFLDTFQREHALIDPVQMNDVSLLEFPQSGDVGSRIGNVDFEKMFAGEMQFTAEFAIVRSSSKCT